MSNSEIRPPVPTVQLDPAHAIPQLGFGTWQVPADQTERVVAEALEVGYRHVDTAQMYGNEAGVGAAVTTSGIPRDQLWLTTKLANWNHSRDDARRSVEESLEALGSPIDLLLVHWPLAMHADVAEVWETVCEIHRDFPIELIGVSNFLVSDLDRLAEAGLPKPVVNQLESNPYFQNNALREATRERGIAVQAYSPMHSGAVFDDPELRAVASDVERDVAQVVLRWVLQRGDIVFPKSTHRDRMVANLDVFDFELSDAQMRRIDALERGERSGMDPATFDMIGK